MKHKPQGRRPPPGLAVVAAALALLAGFTAAVTSRVEARSKSFLAVGVLQGERLTVRVSRLQDNAPVHDAAVEVSTRGLKLNATAQTDGSYAVTSPELAAGGPAVVAFSVMQAGATEKMSGTLEGPAAEKSLEDNGQARQWLWWVLNFGVCIGFLWLYSRRSKAAEARGED